MPIFLVSLLNHLQNGPQLPQLWAVLFEVYMPWLVVLAAACVFACLICLLRLRPRQVWVLAGLAAMLAIGAASGFPLRDAVRSRIGRRAASGMGKRVRPARRSLAARQRARANRPDRFRGAGQGLC